MKVQNLMNSSMKNLLCIALLLFSLFASISAASAVEIVLDPAHHHLGDNFKEELNPAEPDGLVYTTTFTLDPLADIRSAELTVAVKSVVPGPTYEFLDKVYINDIEIGALNDYLPENTSDSAEVDIAIPVHPTIFNPGKNTLNISAGSNEDGSNYDDFEFYNLTLQLNEIEPITLAPPLKVAWTCKFAGELGYEKPAGVSFAEDGVLYLCEDFGEGIVAVDAETGKLLWNKKWSTWLGYKDGVLFSENSSHIEALDAKTGETLWSRESPDVERGTSIIFGDTLFVSTPFDNYVAAIDAENGDTIWENKLRNSVSNPVVNGNFVIFLYHSGLIAVDAKTGQEVWRYRNPGHYFSTPFLCKDLVYVAVIDRGDIIAFSVGSGEEVWKTNAGSWANILEVKNDTLLIDSDTPVLLNADTGEIMKEYPYSELPLSSSVITDNYIYSTDRYRIKVFDSSTGEPVWGSSIIKGSAVSDPALYRDKLYLVSTEGVLYAFEHGEGGMLFTQGLENSAAYYFPQVAIPVMLLLLAILLRKFKNRALVFGSWLIALVGVLLLSIIAIDPYVSGWEVLGLLSALVFFSLPVILLIGIAFLVYGIRKRKK